MLKWFWLAAAFPLLVSAQPGRSLFPWWDNPLSQDLNLTDTQRNQIRAVVKEYRDRLVDERAAVEKAEGQLEDVFGEETVDQRKAAEAIDHLTTARGELTKSLAQMSLRMRTVLTAQQWQDLQRRQGRAGPRGEGKSSRRRGSAPGAAPPASPPNPPGGGGGAPAPPAGFKQ